MPDHHFPGYTGEKHPEIFERQVKGHKEGQLTQEQLNEYYEKGFVLVPNYFTAEELEETKREIEGGVDRLANKLFNAGKVKSKYEDKGFYERLIYLNHDFPGANILLHKGEGALPLGFKKIASNPRLLNLLEDILGPDVAFNPVWNLRTKTPADTKKPDDDVTTVPWHQDSAYLDLSSYSVHHVSAWIPLIDATKENGTLEMISGVHKEGLIAEHTCCAGPTWYVTLEEEEMKKTFGVDPTKDAEMIPVPYGSMVLFSNFTPHRSLNNYSKQVRWSLDFRWQKAGTSGGLYGLKDPVTLRLGGKDLENPDWESFDAVDRSKVSNESMKKDASEFSTLMAGPWMKKWEIVHHNQHTDHWDANPNSWGARDVHG